MRIKEKHQIGMYHCPKYIIITTIIQSNNKIKSKIMLIIKVFNKVHSIIKVPHQKDNYKIPMMIIIYFNPHP